MLNTKINLLYLNILIHKTITDTKALLFHTEVHVNS